MVYNIDKIDKRYDTVTIKQKVNEYLFAQLEIFRLEILKRSVLSEKVAEFDELRERLLKEINSVINKTEFDPEELRSPLVTYKDQFYNFLPSNEDDNIESDIRPKRWQVLFIDDLPSTCKVIEDHFRRNKIHCHTAQTGEDAFKTLRKDEEESEKITLVITDFRFYNDGNDKGKWQDLQGYQILKQIHNEFKSHYAYVMLTSKKGTIQQYIKKQSKFPILWFNKADVLAGKHHSFDIFCQRMIEVGDKAFFRKHNVPNSAVWQTGQLKRIEPGYTFYYKQHIESIDYDDKEDIINDSAIDNIRYVCQTNELRDSFKFEISLIHKKKEGKHGITDNSSKLLNKFRSQILTLRRIYWGLSILLGYSSEHIFELFKKSYLTEDESKNNSINQDKNPKSLKTSIFTSFLGIYKDEGESKDPKYLIKLGLLTEEIDFLNMHLSEFEKSKKEYITEELNDYPILSSFFIGIDYLNEIPEIRRISDKFCDDLKPSYVELDKCFILIREKMDVDEKFKKRFEDASRIFFINDINKLSKKIKTKLLKLNS